MCSHQVLRFLVFSATIQPCSVFLASYVCIYPKHHITRTREKRGAPLADVNRTGSRGVYLLVIFCNRGDDTELTVSLFIRRHSLSDGKTAKKFCDFYRFLLSVNLWSGHGFCAGWASIDHVSVFGARVVFPTRTFLWFGHFEPFVHSIIFTKCGCLPYRHASAVTTLMEECVDNLQSSRKKIHVDGANRLEGWFQRDKYVFLRHSRSNIAGAVALLNA